MVSICSLTRHCNAFRDIKPKPSVTAFTLFTCYRSKIQVLLGLTASKSLSLLANLHSYWLLKGLKVSFYISPTNEKAECSTQVPQPFLNVIGCKPD